MAPPLKRKRYNGSGPNKPIKAGSSEEIVQFDIIELLGSDTVNAIRQAGNDRVQKFESMQEVDVDIVALSSHGDGLGMTTEKDWIVIVPFCLPGERVRAKVYRNDLLSSYADLVQVLDSSSSKRDDALIGCKYFGKCSGCQYQQMPYGQQLLHKQTVVNKAFKHLSGLDSAAIPNVDPTLPSPLQYKYRTKLTPHFEAPSLKLSNSERIAKLDIGFETKGRKKVLDIEECPIATDTVNKGLQKERERVRQKLASYRRGATLLLRHSMTTFDQEAEEVCITDSKEIVKENVAGHHFEFNAGTFFQNNNGILETLVQHVSEYIQPLKPDDPPAYLVDAYCGSGLFSICLAKHFSMVSGVEISDDSVKFARRNAALNHVENVEFVTGKAEAIFETILYPPQQTTVLIDPPRKGCDEIFLNQLVAFSPKQIIYVSCNVHTQARDVGFLVKEGGFRIEALRGADLFPQTYHIEGICILNKG